MVLPGGTQFRTETWTLYSIGMVVIALRLIARIRKRGMTKLQTDDYLTLNLILWYTLLIVSLNEVFFSGGSNFMTPEEEAALTPETIAERVAGSKWVLVVEETMVMTVWTCKLTMLLLYRRVTQGLKQAKLINGAFIYVAMGFVGTQLGLFLNCRPFSEYWAVPTAKKQCWSYFNYQIIEASFNITSDILVLVVAIPIFLKLQIPVLQKGILLTVFGLGIFVIAAAILTKLYSLVPSLLTYAYLNWYCREASVCVYVTNLPAIWSLILEIFPSMRRWGRSTKTPSSGTGTKKMRNFSNSDYRLQQFGKLGSQSGTPGFREYDSQENIVANKGLQGGMAISKDITFTVKRDSASDDDYPVRQHHPGDKSDDRYASTVSAV